ncbi:hypothetical protein BDV12DRAFT_48588 [Aspergillus spectabilis]
MSMMHVCANICTRIRTVCMNLQRAVLHTPKAHGTMTSSQCRSVSLVLRLGFSCAAAESHLGCPERVNGETKGVQPASLRTFNVVIDVRFFHHARGICRGRRKQGSVCFNVDGATTHKTQAGPLARIPRGAADPQLVWKASDRRNTWRRDKIPR